MERFRTQLSKYAKIENFYASVITSDFGEILPPNHGFNIAKVVRLVGLVSGVLLIFVKIFLHFWKDLMSNLSKEATIENFCASECTLEVRENHHQNHCFSDYSLPYSHPKHTISRVFTIFSYCRVLFL